MLLRGRPKHLPSKQSACLLRGCLNFLGMYISWCVSFHSPTLLDLPLLPSLFPPSPVPFFRFHLKLILFWYAISFWICYRDKVDVASRLFYSLQSEAQFLRLTIQEATNSLAFAYKVQDSKLSSLYVIYISYLRLHPSSFITCFDGHLVFRVHHKMYWMIWRRSFWEVLKW